MPSTSVNPTSNRKVYSKKKAKMNAVYAYYSWFARISKGRELGMYSVGMVINYCCSWNGQSCVYMTYCWISWSDKRFLLFLWHHQHDFFVPTTCYELEMLFLLQKKRNNIVISVNTQLRHDRVFYFKH
jgi:hypothetical protein